MYQNSKQLRSYARWSKVEEQKLISEINNKKPRADIARIHKRTFNSINIKLHNIICKYYSNGKSIKQIKKIIHIEEKEIKNVAFSKNLCGGILK